MGESHIGLANVLETTLERACVHSVGGTVVGKYGTVTSTRWKQISSTWFFRFFSPGQKKTRHHKGKSGRNTTFRTDIM